MLINAITSLSLRAHHYGHIFTKLKYRTLSEGYPPWVRHRFCNHHKGWERKEKRNTFPCCTDPCLLPALGLSNPLWSVALSMPVGWHLPYLVFRPSVYSLSLPCFFPSHTHTPWCMQLRHHLLRYWHFAFVCPQWNLACIWPHTSQERCHWSSQHHCLVPDTSPPS